MAEGLNRVMLLGNLGADPELRMTSGGQAVLKLRLATSETYLDRNRARQERTEWHNVVIWGKRAEALSKIITKGTRIFVEGGLRTSSYDDRDGNKRYRTEIVATNILLQGQGGGRGAGGGGGGGGGGYRDAPADEYGDSRGDEGYRPSSGPAPGADFPETEDDDIPF
ncbi:MAG TPA: single-stranded DNA-binding protein [Polyangiaceae bacterium]|nr:single-stranded DNA-binding protein [Polyangiaceae bacterium]